MLTDLLNRFAGKRAVVIGDPIVDRYVFGTVDRVSPEAPVPVLKFDRTEVRRGGADNVVANLEALGLNVRTIFPPSEAWSVKSRYMVGGHQLLRVDRDQDGRSDAYKGWMIAQEIQLADVVVLSDYAKGALTDHRCQHAITEAIVHGKPVVVDPKGPNWEKYRGASLICQNEREWKAHLTHGATRPFFRAVFVKRGEFGIDVLEDNQTARNHPARARAVFDVTGAGDTVVAVAAACLAAGGSLDAAASLANVAAGIVVGEVGTTAVDLGRLRSAVAGDSGDGEMAGLTLAKGWNEIKILGVP